MKPKLFTLLFFSVIFATYAIYDIATIIEFDFFSAMIDFFLIMLSIIGLAVFAFKIVELNGKNK